MTRRGWKCPASAGLAALAAAALVAGPHPVRAAVAMAEPARSETAEAAVEKPAAERPPAPVPPTPTAAPPDPVVPARARERQAPTKETRSDPPPERGRPTPAAHPRHSPPPPARTPHERPVRRPRAEPRETEPPDENAQVGRPSEPPPRRADDPRARDTLHAPAGFGPGRGRAPGAPGERRALPRPPGLVRADAGPPDVPSAKGSELLRAIAHGRASLYRREPVVARPLAPTPRAGVPVYYNVAYLHWSSGGTHYHPAYVHSHAYASVHRLHWCYPETRWHDAVPGVADFPEAFLIGGVAVLREALLPWQGPPSRTYRVHPGFWAHAPGRGFHYRVTGPPYEEGPFSVRIVERLPAGSGRREARLVDGGARAAMAGHWDDARRRFRVAVDEYPQSAPAHYDLGICYELRGNLAAALWHYREAWSLREGATRYELAATDLAARYPEIAEAWMDCAHDAEFEPSLFDDEDGPETSGRAFHVVEEVWDSPGYFYVDAGRAQGLSVGMRMVVLADLRTLGGRADRPVAFAEVLGVRARSAVLRVLRMTGRTPVSPGCRVRPA